MCQDFLRYQFDKLVKTAQKAMDNPRRAVGAAVGVMAASFVLSEVAASAATLGFSATFGAVVVGVSLSAIAQKVL